MLLESPEATEALGCVVAEALRAGDAIALFGELGTGKTTFTRGLLRGLGFDGDVSSPTFPIVLTYEELRVPVWHVDLYRIEDPEELTELGLEEARSDTALIIEWPERLGNMLWSDALQLHLTSAPGDARSLTAIVPPAWGDRWLPR